MERVLPPHRSNRYEASRPRLAERRRGGERPPAAFIAFYVGRGDTRFLAENEQLNYELARAKIPHTFRLYAGGLDQTLWQTYAAPWLSLALAHLDQASG